MIIKQPSINLKQTLKGLKIQVIDSLPTIDKYIPSDINSPEQLFYYLKDKVIYKQDPPGVEYIQTVQTLAKNDYYGDCDCFTVLVISACEYLGFKSQLVLSGKNKSVPTHVYSMAWDENKNKFCSMDLTNPYYCMERKYNYKQTIPFMILQLADSFNLSGRKERKKLKVIKTAEKEKRKISRMQRVTGRLTTKEKRKATKRDTKVLRKEKKQLRVVNRKEKIQERHENKIRQDEADATMNPFFSPDSDQSYTANESIAPGSTWQASEADNYTDEYELLPSEEEEEEEESGLSFAPVIVGAVTKIAKKLKESKAGKVVTGGVSKYDDIVKIKEENKFLKTELESEKRNKFYFGGSGLAVGTLAGYFLGRK